MTILEQGIPNPDVQFTCPVCKSRFRAVYCELEEIELDGPGAGVDGWRFNCPICGKSRFISELDTEE